MESIDAMEDAILRKVIDTYNIDTTHIIYDATNFFTHIDTMQKCESAKRSHTLVLNKSTLIKKAIGADALPIGRSETTLYFPWFRVDALVEDVQTYITFIAQLCTTAKARKRIIAVERNVINEKYAFRCFLLKLGFIGDEYKVARKTLIARLEGDSAFKHSKKRLD